MMRRRGGQRVETEEEEEGEKRGYTLNGVIK